MKRLEGMSCEEHLKTLGSTGLKRSKLWSKLMALCSFLSRGQGKGSADLIFLVFSDELYENGSKLYKGKFKFNIGK